MVNFKSLSLTESPEMLNNNSYFNNSDLWSLGIIIYYLNFKEFPFKGNTEFQSLKNINDNIKNIKKIKDNELNKLLKMILIISHKTKLKNKNRSNFILF